MTAKPSVNGDFTPETARVAGRNSARMRPGPQLRKLLDAQQHAWEAATDPSVEPKYQAGLLRAYHDLTRLVMDYQGHGKPKSVPARNDPGAKPRKAQVPAGPLPDKPDA